MPIEINFHLVGYTTLPRNGIVIQSRAKRKQLYQIAYRGEWGNLIYPLTLVNHYSHVINTYWKIHNPRPFNNRVKIPNEDFVRLKNDSSLPPPFIDGRMEATFSSTNSKLRPMENFT